VLRDPDPCALPFPFDWAAMAAAAAAAIEGKLKQKEFFKKPRIIYKD
jgi:hypothetical protein